MPIGAAAPAVVPVLRLVGSVEAAVQPDATTARDAQVLGVVEPLDPLGVGGKLLVHLIGQLRALEKPSSQ